MNHNKIEVQFNKSLEDTDYGLIVGKDGNLKGIWVPNTIKDDAIPDEIINLCVEYFGVDPGSEQKSATLQ
jgi:hypothetical protein